jgi:hypothetical protein
VVHLRQSGFPVRGEDLDDLSGIKTKHGVPLDLQSCHTALVDGYVVEGHVPADLIVRLLRERPAVTGLAVPGMPAGSPGMESPDGFKTPYQVLAFTKDGQSRVYASK